MVIYEDFDLRKKYKQLKKEKKLQEVKELLLSRINHNFMKKGGYYRDYCAQTFTSYFYAEVLKLLIKLSENEKAIVVYQNALKLPHLRREDEIAFSLIIGTILPRIPIENLPTFKTKVVRCKIITIKGKQKFQSMNGNILFAEEVALEYYRNIEKLKGIWLNPSTEQIYFETFRSIIGQKSYEKITGVIYSCMGHICNRCYGAPDLLLYQPGLFKNRNLKFTEIKGPKDKLSAAQYVWIEHLNKFQIPFELFKIEDLNTDVS